jgi:transporter family protein
MSPQYLVLLSIFGWGVGSLFYKVANDNAHPLMVSTIVTVVYIVLTPIPFMFMKFNTSVNTTGIIFSILGGLCMCVGSLGYFYSLRSGNAGNVTILTSLYPALTLLLSCIFMKETIGLKQGIGMGLALVSFILLSMK